MAVVNVRVDDEVVATLKEMAESQGQTLSEYVRDRLLEVVHPIEGGAKRVEHGDEPAPETMTTFQRQSLALLHRILARVLPEDANGEDGDLEYQLERAQIVESGFTGQYWRTVAGFETELSVRDCEYVSEILQMFRVITFSIDKLGRDGSPVDADVARDLQFEGFDHNDTREGHMARYVRFIMRERGVFDELRPQIDAHDRGNSHMPTLDIYLRMLSEFRRIMKSRERSLSYDSYLLTAEELTKLVDAQTHPSRR